MSTDISGNHYPTTAGNRQPQYEGQIDALAFRQSRKMWLTPVSIHSFNAAHPTREVSMKKTYPQCAIAMLLCVSGVSGNAIADIKPGIASPGDATMSLTESMRTLQEKVAGKFNFVVFSKDLNDHSNWNNTMDIVQGDVTTNASQCQLNFQVSIGVDGKSIAAGKVALQLRDVESATVMTAAQSITKANALQGNAASVVTQTVPPMFSLWVAQKQGLIERNANNNPNFQQLFFADRATADRVAGAVARAALLCHGTSKPAQ
jgi:hypothetical protein